MLYRKNMGRAERALRLVTGALLAAGAALWLGASAAGLALLAAGAIAMATGFLGYCPACALAGRRPLS